MFPYSFYILFFLCVYQLEFVLSLGVFFILLVFRILTFWNCAIYFIFFIFCDKNLESFFVEFFGKWFKSLKFDFLYFEFSLFHLFSLTLKFSLFSTQIQFFFLSNAFFSTISCFIIKSNWNVVVYFRYNVCLTLD